MSCASEQLISIDQALAHYAKVKRLKTISIPLLQAHEHILAEKVVSPVSLPLFTQSAVDGYALRSEDIQSGMREFELIGEIRAGISENFEIKTGQTVRIFTGGKLPTSADTVARQEIVRRDAKKVILNERVSVGSDIRYQGEELQQGTELAAQGLKLHSGLIAALSMAGVQNIQVYQQPKIYVLITGDEISTELENDAKVFDANAPMMITWLKEQGLTHIHVEHVIDEESILKAALEHAFAHYDLIISTGGVSVGDYDLIRPVSMALGAKEVFWKVAQKPGKPLFFAAYHHGKHQSYLLGLPGNPAAVMVCLVVHVATLLRALQGAHSVNPHWQIATLKDEIKLDHREQLLRMVLDSNAHGQLNIGKLSKQQSHMLSNLNKANVIARIPALSHASLPLNYIEFIYMR